MSVKQYYQGTTEVVYGMRFINNIQAKVLGFLKALVWPVFFVYQALKFFVTR